MLGTWGAQCDLTIGSGSDGLGGYEVVQGLGFRAVGDIEEERVPGAMPVLLELPNWEFEED
jgi:hypothetical protein